MMHLKQPSYLSNDYFEKKNVSVFSTFLTEIIVSNLFCFSVVRYNVLINIRPK